MTQIPYSITISPPERTQAIALKKLSNPLRMIYLDDMLLISQVLKKSKIRNYIIYPELDPRGRLHYHGTINMNKTQLTRYYKYSRPWLQRIGYIDCSPTKNPIEWLIYCRKEWSYTKEVLEIDERSLSPILNSHLKTT